MPVIGGVNLTVCALGFCWRDYGPSPVAATQKQANSYFNILLSFSEHCWELPLQMRIMHSWKALTSETITSAGSRLTFHKVSLQKHTFWTFHFFNWQRFCKSSVWREDWSEYIICITSVVRLQIGDIVSLRIAQILWKLSVTFSILGCIQSSNWDEVFFAAWKQEKQG